MKNPLVSAVEGFCLLLTVCEVKMMILLLYIQFVHIEELIDMFQCLSFQAGNTGFAVPQGIRRTNITERPPRPPTVDLTGNDPPQRLGRGGAQYTCQVCDKTYSSPDLLNQHMQSHRTNQQTKIPYRSVTSINQSLLICKCVSLPSTVPSVSQSSTWKIEKI